MLPVRVPQPLELKDEGDSFSLGQDVGLRGHGQSFRCGLCQEL